ncbi:MAG: hypothetical protein Q9167_005506 [Letrouitia subvulpina]
MHVHSHLVSLSVAVVLVILPKNSIFKAFSFDTQQYDFFSYAQNATICDDGTVCMNPSNRTCCAQGKGKQEVHYNNNAAMPTGVAQLDRYYANGDYRGTAALQTTLPPVSQTGLANKTRAAFPTTTTSLSSSSNASSDLSSNNYSHGIRAGIGAGIGASLGMMLIALLVFLVWYRRRRRNLADGSSSTTGNLVKCSELGCDWVGEMDAGPPPPLKEMDENCKSDKTLVQEMPGLVWQEIQTSPTPNISVKHKAVYLSFASHVLCPINLAGVRDECVPTEPPQHPYGVLSSHPLRTIQLNDQYFGWRKATYYTTSDGLAVIDGDIIYGRVEDLLAKNGALNRTQRQRKRALSGLAAWPSATIKFTYLSEETEINLSATVNEAIRRWKTRAPYLKFSKLENSLYHEHQRPDRDKYVSFHCTNLVPDCEPGESLDPPGSNCCDGANTNIKCCKNIHQFEIYDDPSYDSSGLYDVHSVMHYSSKAFAIGNTSTLTSTNPAEPVPDLSNPFPSTLDFERICMMYHIECLVWQQSGRNSSSGQLA